MAAAKFSSTLIKDDNTITVFSDDSDLLIYEYASNVRIVTLRDLYENVDDGKPTWSGSQYWPHQIAAKATTSTGDLIDPAYLMSKDLYTSLEKAFRKIGSAGFTHDKNFKNFAETFSIDEESKDWTRIKDSPGVNSDLASRDSRVSELIWQLQSLGDGAGQGGLRMYLPFLTDDISRFTAWNVATDVRQLAYSILLQTFHHDTAVQEYRRSGTRVASVLVDKLSDTEIITEADALSGYVKALFAWLRNDTDLDGDQVWACLAMQHVMKYCVSDGQSLPSLDDMIRAMTSRKERKWHVLHLNAQFQAAFYSLRILKQILAFALAQETKRDETGSLAKLSALLGDLPRITEFFAERHAESAARRKAEDRTWRGLLDSLLFALTGKEETEGDSQQKEARPRKKAKKNKKSKVGSSTLAENPFAMLAEES